MDLMNVMELMNGTVVMKQNELMKTYEIMPSKTPKKVISELIKMMKSENWGLMKIRQF